MQLGYQEEHDVRFPDAAQAPGHLTQLVREFAHRRALDLQYGQQFPQPPGRDASPMNGSDIAGFNAWHLAGKALEAGA
jgi:hypothetical protein